MSVVVGEVVHIVKCLRVEVEIRKSDYCYGELPVQHGNETLFLAPRSRILISHGRRVTCDKRMPPMFKIKDQWFRFMPDMIDAPAPQIIKPLSRTQWKYASTDALAVGGVYAEKDQKKYRDLIIFPLERPSVLNQVAMTVSGEMADKMLRVTLSGNKVTIDHRFTMLEMKVLVLNHIPRRTYALSQNLGGFTTTWFTLRSPSAAAALVARYCQLKEIYEPRSEPNLPRPMEILPESFTRRLRSKRRQQYQVVENSPSPPKRPCHEEAQVKEEDDDAPIYLGEQKNEKVDPQPMEEGQSMPNGNETDNDHNTSRAGSSRASNSPNEDDKGEKGTSSKGNEATSTDNSNPGEEGYSSLEGHYSVSDKGDGDDVSLIWELSDSPSDSSRHPSRHSSRHSSRYSSRNLLGYSSDDDIRVDRMSICPCEHQCLSNGKKND
ncbi:unnamed protein product [Trichogramma brassicae]|uniref:Uncharacterized protein n=1 Tax=Trichogramma brassicae TaxID=86971 RepID=A0A6H5J349_9HYME|nr:unnamed protein product [Trichogramma brassicae]